jgi:hypothetical protein
MDNTNSSNYQLPSVDDSQLIVDDPQATSSTNSDMGASSNQTITNVPKMSDQNSTLTDMTDPSMPLQAEDVDLIEKAWVEKAKAIVRSTHGDPYRQNKELSKVKAEYIRKRYNRNIKVSE